MSYETFDNQFRKDRNKTMTYLGLIIILLIILGIIVEGKKKYAIYKTAPFLDHQFLSKDICYAGFFSIVKKGAVSSLVSDKYIRLLNKMNYSMIDFSIDKDDFRLIKSIDKTTCKVIVHDQATKGHQLRSFQIKLKHNEDYIFEYKIDQIAELLLEENDLLEIK